MNWRRGLGLCLLVLTAFGCTAAGRASLPLEPAPDAAQAGGNAALAEGDAVALTEPQPTVLESVKVADAAGPDGMVKVEIKATESINYTSYEPDSHHFILEIPNVSLSEIPSEIAIGKAGIDVARVSEVPAHNGRAHARIEFEGTGEVEARILPQGKTLAVLLKGDDTPRLIGNVEPVEEAPVPLEPVTARAEAMPLAAPPAARNEILPPATLVSGVVVEKSGAGASVAVMADGEIEHRSFTLTNPDRLVLDLDGVVNSVPEKIIAVGSSVLDKIRIAQFRTKPEKVVRVVFDLESATDYEVRNEGDVVRVFLGPAAEIARQEVQPERSAEPVRIASAKPVAAESVPTPDQVLGAARDEAPAPATAVTPADESEHFDIDLRGDDSGEEMEDVVKSPAPAAVAPRPVQRAAAAPAAAPARLVPSSPLDLGKDIVLFDRADPEEGGASTGFNIPGGTTFQSQTIAGEKRRYRGEKISVTFRDADIREVFFFFADIMKMNVVLDPDVTGRIDIRLTQVPWDQAFSVILKNQGLDAIEEDRVIRIAKIQKLRTEAADRRALKQAQEQEVDPITFTRQLSYAKVSEALPILQQVKTGRGKIIADIRTNTLIISDIPSSRAAYENLISALDTQTPQVSIEARIVEAIRSFERSLGIDWGFSARATPALGTQTNLSFPHRAELNADVNLSSQSQAGTIGIALGNVLDSVTLDVTLDAFEADGKVRILSAPKVVTQNNQAAQIEQGVQIPVVTTTATEIEVQYVPASLRLIVTPQITAEQTVIMKVQVENNQPSATITVGDTPGIVTERVETQILVRSGTTAVIGGVYKLQETDNELGIPGLRRIPFFGWLFKNKSFEKQSSELLVFLTPRIVTNV